MERGRIDDFNSRLRRFSNNSNFVFNIRTEVCGRLRLAVRILYQLIWLRIEKVLRQKISLDIVSSVPALMLFLRYIFNSRELNSFACELTQILFGFEYHRMKCKLQNSDSDTSVTGSSVKTSTILDDSSEMDTTANSSPRNQSGDSGTDAETMLRQWLSDKVEKAWSRNLKLLGVTTGNAMISTLTSLSQEISEAEKNKIWRDEITNKLGEKWYEGSESRKTVRRCGIWNLDCE